MLVRDVMQSKLITIDPETTLPQAMRLAAERRVRHLPVVRDGELIGIVSDRDPVGLSCPSCGGAAPPRGTQGPSPRAGLASRGWISGVAGMASLVL